jgi:hypothetical protein
MLDFRMGNTIPTPYGGEEGMKSSVFWDVIQCSLVIACVIGNGYTSVSYLEFLPSLNQTLVFYT